MHRPTPRLALLAAVVTAAVAITACGSSSPQSTVTSSSGSHGTILTGAALRQFDTGAVKFSGCMRSHGIAAFPDTRNPSEFKQAMAPGTPGTQAPAFQTAQKACAYLLPTQSSSGGEQRTHAQITAFLAFAACIRRHGFPHFPDPTASGQLTHEMLSSAGINLHQPAVVQAADACTSVSHGFVTRADVARFIAGQ
jgi:hypothetical protein